MYRVIVADDEPWVAYRLLHLADWEHYGFQVIDTATNGIEAMEKCLAAKPDVLFSDIRMPGMDGLEMMEALRDQSIDIEIVLVSGYAEFAYAQRALRMGAFDYLIKQVSRDQLHNLLIRLAKKLGEKNQGLDTFFTLLDEDSELSIREWLLMEHQDVDHRRFRFCTFAINEGDYPDLVYEHSAPGYRQIIIRTGRHKASALLCYNHNDTCADEWLEPDTCCGYSEELDADASFVLLYRQSDIAFLTASFLQTEKPILYVKEYDAPYIVNLLGDLEHALRLKDDRRCLETLHALRNACGKLMISQIAEVYNGALKVFSRDEKQVSDLLQPYDYRWLASEYTSLTDMFDYFQSSIAQVNQQCDCLPSSILRVIDESYRQDLRVSDLAKQFHYTPSYFSTLFRKLTGQPFTKYIADMRINYAKKLLRESGLSIQDVADQSGYGDYFQFNKTFKRITGLTPGQYRKME
ncbi:MAG: response regulator [Eubacteriales bacterium]|nr:response regulator [Eubacteriales bacterium]